MKRENFLLLLNQFASAKGIKNIDVNSSSFMDEFAAWILERQKSGEYFKDLLDYMEFDYTASNVVEANKSKQDSLILPYESTLVTPFYDGLQISHKRLVPAIFGMSGITPTAYTDEYSIALNLCFLNTFMINNPYEEEYLLNAENLFTDHFISGEVGFYGSKDDKDIDKKIEQFEKLKDRIDGNYREECVSINGNYAMALLSPTPVRRRVKTL